MSSSDSLTGRLLVATPLLRDPNFDRAVVLVLSHDDDGALGVVVNRPTTVLVTDILPNWQPVVSAPEVVFQGGPVSLDSALGLVAMIDGAEPLGVRRVSGRVGVVDLDTPPEVVQPGVVAMRVFAGYAGWSPEQLENEIAEGSWYVVESQTDDAFSGDADDLWKAVLRRQDGPLALMATFPTDPSLN
jgi:putative transcriptional regulator